MKSAGKIQDENLQVVNIQGYVYLGKCLNVYGVSQLKKYKFLHGEKVKMLNTKNICVFVFLD